MKHWQRGGVGGKGELGSRGLMEDDEIKNQNHDSVKDLK